jgi:hypothetical protein
VGAGADSVADWIRFDGDVGRDHDNSGGLSDECGEGLVRCRDVLAVIHGR